MKAQLNHNKTLTLEILTFPLKLLKLDLVEDSMFFSLITIFNVILMLMTMMKAKGMKLIIATQDDKSIGQNSNESIL